MEVSSLDIALYRWLEPFLENIKGKGLTVSADTRIQLLKIIREKSFQFFLPDDNVKYEVLFDYLSPVLAKTSEQQRLLRESFYEYFHIHPVETEIKIQLEKEKEQKDVQAQLARRKKLLKKIWGIALAVLVVVSLGFIIYHYIIPTHKVEANYQVQFIDASTPVQFDATNSFYDYNDTSDAVFSWDFGDGITDSSGNTVIHQYEQPGNYQTSLTITANNSRLKIVKGSDKKTINLCKPQLFLRSNRSQEIPPGDSVTFQPVYNALFPSSGKNTWLLNDEVIAHDLPELTIPFQNTGLQVVSYIDSGYSGISDCQGIRADASVYVKEPSGIAVDIVQSGEIEEPPIVLSSVFLWLAGLVLLGSLAALLWSWSKIIASRKKVPMNAEDILSKFHGTKPPYEIPFKNYEDIIDDEPYLSKLARKLKRRMPDESIYINLPLTIHETIRSEGLIVPAWSYKTRPVEYLVLIERVQPNNQLVKVFEYLLKRFGKSDLFIEQFYFSKSPLICTSNKYNKGISLSRLFDMYPTHTLIIFSDGQPFLHKSYPALDKELAAVVNKWEQTVICTPKTYSDWNFKEKILQQTFQLLPADLEGQLLLFAKLEGLEDNYQEYLYRLQNGYSLQHFDFDDADDLKAYLGSEFLFQWLCAIAIYPALQWQPLLALGDALQKAAYPKEIINYTLLLKLGRIPWMQAGSMPDDTRLELLKQLQPANELIARKTLITVMNDAASGVTEKSFVYEQLEMQRITDKFMLYAQDPNAAEHAAYKTAYGQFKTLWSKNQVPDYPLAEYLKKEEEGGDWSTLVGNRNLSRQPSQSQPIDDYFDESTPLQSKRWTKLLKASVISVVIVLSIIMGVSMFKKEINSTAIDKFLYLTHVDDTYKQAFSFLLEAGTCMSLDKSKADSLYMDLELKDNLLVPIQAGDSIAQTDIAFAGLRDQPVKLRIRSNDPGYIIDTSFILTGNNVRIKFRGCPVQCNNWERLAGSELPLDMKGKWYDMGLVNGLSDTYAAMLIDTDYINGEQVLETYNCAEDKSLYKAICGSFKEFRNYTFNYNSGDVVMDFTRSSKIFTSRAEAIDDTTRQGNARLFCLDKGRWTSIANNVFVQSLQGNWKAVSDIQDNSYDISNAGVGYAGIVWQIHYPAVQIVGNDSFYMCKLARGASIAGTIDSMVLFLHRTNNTQLYISTQALHSEKSDKEEGSNEWFNREGKFNEYTKPDSTINDAAADLPLSLNEIWKGSSNNRLIRIDIPNKRIYYSTGSTSSYGTYPITSVTQSNAAVYRITSNTGNGFKVFFIRNVSQQTFELSVCQQLYSNQQQAETTKIGYCDPFNKMQLYYENNPRLIYLPVAGNTLATSEANKLRAIADTLSKGNGYSLHTVLNVEYMGKSNTDIIINYLKRLGMAGDPVNVTATMGLANPFNRNAVMVMGTKSDRQMLQDYQGLNGALEKEYMSDYERATTDRIAATVASDGLKRIMEFENEYRDVSAATGIPWYVIGLINLKENDGNLNAGTFSPNSSAINQQQQQPNAYSGKTSSDEWVKQTISYFQRTELIKWNNWQIPGILYMLEKRNGWSYRNANTHTPYLWSGTSIYERGPSRIAGIVAVLKLMQQQNLTRDNKASAY